jgi:citrate lyase beta subunit
MFKSYFFIPANNKRFIEKTEILGGIDFRVFDLEDSVLPSDLENSIKLLSSIEIKNSDWLRIPINENNLMKVVKDSIKLGIDNFVIPKFEGLAEFQKIANQILTINPRAEFILLLENGKSYIELEKILFEFSQYIYGISLGIHDFSFATGMKNDYMLQRNIRTNIMLLAKAYSVEPIDVVSMYLRHENKLKDEILDGFNIGYRSKFLIHPTQLNVLKSVKYYSKEEIYEFENVLNFYLTNIVGKEALFSYNDRVYEKMHIEEIKKIVRWGNEYYGTDREIF